MTAPFKRYLRHFLVGSAVFVPFVIAFLIAGIDAVGWLLVAVLILFLVPMVGWMLADVKDTLRRDRAKRLRSEALTREMQKGCGVHGNGR